MLPRISKLQTTQETYFIKISKNQIVVFLKQLISLLNAGISLYPAIAIVSSEISGGKFNELLNKIMDVILNLMPVYDIIVN